MTPYSLAGVLLTALSVTSYSTGSAERAAARFVLFAHDSVCASLPAVHDSAHLVVVARARAADSTLHLPAPFLDYLAEAVRQHFVPPAVLPLPLMGSTIGSAPCYEPHLSSDSSSKNPGKLTLPRPVTQTICVDIVFTLRDKGPTTDLAVGRQSINPTLEASLAQAVRAITQEDYVPPPEGVHNPRIHVTLYTTSEPTPEQQGFFKVLLPVYTLEKDVLIDRPVRPIYPSVAQQASIGDTEEVTFVVDEHGKAMPETEDVTKARYREFIESVLESLRQTRFLPARANSCPVKFLVHAPFIFWYHALAPGRNSVLPFQLGILAIQYRFPANYLNQLRTSRRSQRPRHFVYWRGEIAADINFNEFARPQRLVCSSDKRIRHSLMPDVHQRL